MAVCIAKFGCMIRGLLIYCFKKDTYLRHAIVYLELYVIKLSKRDKLSWTLRLQSVTLAPKKSALLTFLKHYCGERLVACRAQTAGHGWPTRPDPKCGDAGRASMQNARDTGTCNTYLNVYAMYWWTVHRLCYVLTCNRPDTTEYLNIKRCFLDLRLRLWLWNILWRGLTCWTRPDRHWSTLIPLWWLPTSEP